MDTKSMNNNENSFDYLIMPATHIGLQSPLNKTNPCEVSLFRSEPIRGHYPLSHYVARTISQCEQDIIILAEQSHALIYCHVYVPILYPITGIVSKIVSLSKNMR